MPKSRSLISWWILYTYGCLPLHGNTCHDTHLIWYRSAPNWTLHRSTEKNDLLFWNFLLAVRGRSNCEWLSKLDFYANCKLWLHTLLDLQNKLLLVCWCILFFVEKFVMIYECKTIIYLTNFFRNVAQKGILFKTYLRSYKKYNFIKSCKKAKSLNVTLTVTDRVKIL